jgi:hypothetical protein
MDALSANGSFRSYRGLRDADELAAYPIFGPANIARGHSVGDGTDFEKLKG